jgi:hypothetical protein
MQTPGSIDMGRMTDDTAIDTAYVDVVALCFTKLLPCCGIVQRLVLLGCTVGLLLAFGSTVLSNAICEIQEEI